MKMTRLVVLGLLAASSAALNGCYNMRPSAGGAQTTFAYPRPVNPDAVALPAGYRLRVMATGLTFPTGVTFDEAGRAYVTEAGYAYGEVWTRPRLLRLEPDGRHTEIAAGENSGPWNGVTFHQGAFYVADGNVLGGGRILRITPAGQTTLLASNLPSMGDHHANGPVVGPDGWLYFALGTVSNSGVVGEDNARFGWLHRWPELHDVPGADIILTGHNFVTGNPLGDDARQRVVTGAFLPFGTPSCARQRIEGRVPSNGSVLRVRPDGGELAQVAWGLRNPFGLAFSPNGQLFVTENGFDDRGSRPLWGTPDVLWAITNGVWYGWPDFAAGLPVNHSGFQPPYRDAPRFLLAEHPNPPPRPVARFGVHASANGMDFSRELAFGHVGEVFVALFGDQAPTVGKVLHPVGFKVVRVDVRNGVITDFAVNKGRYSGPASEVGGGGLERPVAVRFNPAGDALYIVDFGVLTETRAGTRPRPGTGVIWRVERIRSY